MLEDIIEVNPVCILNSLMANLNISNDIVDRIKVAQTNDEKLQGFLISVDQVENGEDGVIRFKGRLCVPTDEDLRNEILHEAHHSKYTIHPGVTKMYQDMKRMYWWQGMKRDVVSFVAKCLTCQQVKFEHQKPGGQLQPLDIPKWKWENITCDFVVGLPKTKRNNDAIWVVVDRLTKAAHFIPVRMMMSMQQLVKLYMENIVKLH